VRYDRRGVPHVFAQSELDAYRALGYVVARDRLFQLDVQTRAASGRLAELVGARALAIDSEPRLLGLPAAAERKLAAVPRGSPRAAALDAYAAGVNAWIDALTPAEWPVEYRLLGARPERWAPINTMHLANRMGYTLAYEETELTRLRAAALVARDGGGRALPRGEPDPGAIQPNGAAAPRFDTTSLAPPGARAPAAARAVALLPPAVPSGAAGEPPTGAASSNNWAVSPRRTAAGHALLAGDPHLALSLPSVWYEAHLVVPGELDVYGVTIPGAPAIIIALQPRRGVDVHTNTGADVVDFYRETVDDPVRPTRYEVDGALAPRRAAAGDVPGPGGRVLRTDTVRYTHRGPLRHLGGEWLSMRWTLLEGTERGRRLRARGAQPHRA
jgi:penicillin amidase